MRESSAIEQLLMSMLAALDGAVSEEDALRRLEGFGESDSTKHEVLRLWKSGELSDVRESS